jgi:hypothetical protein
VNILLVFSIAGAVATAYETITDPTGVPRRLAETLPRVSWRISLRIKLIFIFTLTLLTFVKYGN